MDQEQWEADLAEEATERGRLETISRRYAEIVGQYEGGDAEEATDAPGGA
jgi:hypothetical protein